MIKIVTATISDDDTWTDPITPDFRDIIGRGNINVSISDGGAPPVGWSANVRLQRRFIANEETPSVKTDWYDVLVFTSDSQQTLEENEEGVQYRIGCDSDDYESGTIDVRLSY